VQNADIHKIAGVLSSDSSAVENREDVFGALGLNLAQMLDAKAADGSGSYEF
jgi:hypothetical protein